MCFSISLIYVGLQRSSYWGRICVQDIRCLIIRPIKNEFNILNVQIVIILALGIPTRELIVNFHDDMYGSLNKRRAHNKKIAFFVNNQIIKIEFILTFPADCSHVIS